MNCLPPNMVQAAGWALVHFLWQGLAIAALLAATFRLLRRSPANHRYLAGCLALLLMALAPLITFRLVMPHSEPLSEKAAPIEFAPTQPETVVTTPVELPPQAPVVVATATPEPRHAIKVSERLENYFPVAGAGVDGWRVRAFMPAVRGLAASAASSPPLNATD